MCVLVYVCMYVCYGYISSYHHSCISSVIHLITSSTSSLLLLSFNAFHWLFLSFSDSLSLLDGSQLVCVFSILCIISIRFYLILLSSFLWPGHSCGPLWYEGIMIGVQSGCIKSAVFWQNNLRRKKEFHRRDTQNHKVTYLSNYSLKPIFYNFLLNGFSYIW